MARRTPHAKFNIWTRAADRGTTPRLLAQSQGRCLAAMVGVARISRSMARRRTNFGRLVELPAIDNSGPRNHGVSICLQNVATAKLTGLRTSPSLTKQRATYLDLTIPASVLSLRPLVTEHCRKKQNGIKNKSLSLSVSGSPGCQLTQESRFYCNQLINL